MEEYYAGGEQEWRTFLVFFVKNTRQPVRHTFCFWYSHFDFFHFNNLNQVEFPTQNRNRQMRFGDTTTSCGTRPIPSKNLQSDIALHLSVTTYFTLEILRQMTLINETISSGLNRQCILITFFVLIVLSMLVHLIHVDLQTNRFK